VNQRTIEASAPRILPAITDLNRAFWTGGANGELLIQRCSSCGRWVHPPTERCAACAGELHPEPVSGSGTVFTFTENVQRFHPDVAPPYVIAVVELDEQADLRLPTNIVRCDADALYVGMPVRVLFEPHGDVFVPVFEPAAPPVTA
jgi:uncharacterized OB-fold protein